MVKAVKMSLTSGTKSPGETLLRGSSSLSNLEIIFSISSNSRPHGNLPKNQTVQDLI